MVTSSAWFEPAASGRPALIVFGGGFTLYALDADTGALYWKHAYTGRPDLPPDPAHDGTRIFSSPVVVDGKVIIGVSADGDTGRRGYIAAADLATGAPDWIRETDVDASGTVLNDGCGSVWSSGSVIPREDLVVFDVGDCHFSRMSPFDESIIAMHADDGTIAWRYQPPRADELCDFDFGASVNVGLNPGGVAKFLGVGGKDGTYYSLDPRTGQLRWSTNVVFGGFVGGFIATAAYDGDRVYGATALGDFGRFETNGSNLCDPSDPRDTALQEPSVHEFDARTGAVSYAGTGGASFAPTTVAGGMTFNCPALRPDADVRDASTGQRIASVALPAPCWSGIATVGNALVLGTGASFSGAGSGIMALTPGGAPPN
jgi:outer membrane protein assembly factor BamB